MSNRKWFGVQLVLFAGFVSAPILAQPSQGEKQDPDKKEFGKKGFPGGPGGFGGAGGMMGKRRELIPQFDKDGDGRLNAEERQAAREFVKKQGGPGGMFGKGPGGKGPGGKGPGGFGPGMFMAKSLMEGLDTDKDGKITRAELLAGINKFFAECDKDKKGILDETQIAEGINRLLPPPPGFPGVPKDGPDGWPKPGFPKGGFFGVGPGKGIASSIVKRADANKDEKVSLDELNSAAETLFKEIDKEKTGKLDEGLLAAGVNLLMPAFGPPGGFGKGKNEPGKPGPKVSPADVKSYPDAGFYDTTVLRTIFLEFDNKNDWEAELADFYHSDVDVPATAIVDGKKYPDVGVHFRGNSSYFTVPAGSKRSIHLSFDYVNGKQRLYGYKSTNLLNAHDDPTFMHTVLFCNMSRLYLPAPRANFVKLVINGESWGIYANQQIFNKEFLQENFKTTKGARWKVPGHPGASGGLNYIGDNIADYKRHYEIKSADDDKAWKALIALCKTLDRTPIDKLEKALRPMLDIDSVLWFLAIDNAVINDDGYWTRNSDYELYRDPKGVFHIVAHDTNETFQAMGFGFGMAMGGGFGKGPKDGGEKGPKEGGGFGKGPKDGPGGKGGGYALDPLIGLENTRAPLRSRLLSVPRLKEQYLKNMRTLANEQFDWKKLKPVIDQYRTLIEKEIELDTRKLTSLAEFKAVLSETAEPGGGGSGKFNLKTFADQRRSYLLNHPEIKKLAAP